MPNNAPAEISPDGIPVNSDGFNTPNPSEITAAQKVAESIAPKVEPAKPAETAKPVTPAEPAEPAEKQAPAKADEEKASVDISDFLKVLGKESDDVKPDEKKEEVKVEPKPVQPQVQTPAKQPVKPRDYSGLPDNIKPLFERMSNDAFDTLKPVYLKHVEQEAKIKELEQGRTTLPDNYLEHPKSFMLLPEFTNAVSDVNTAQAVYNHWRQQYNAVRLGDATYKKLSYNEKGELVESDPIAVSKTTEFELEELVYGAREQLANAQAGVQGIIKEHSTKHADAVNWLRGFESTAFKTFEGNDALKAIVDDTVKRLHPAYQKSPLARPLAKAMHLIMQLGTILKANQSVVKPASNGATAQVNPTAGEIAGDVGGKGDSKAKTLGEDIADFQKFKDGTL